MSEIKILIAEDNPVHASKMEMLLDELGYHLIGIYPTEEEVLRLFRATKPDILILDIGLAEGGDGVTIAGKVNEIRPTPIIFATSFEDKETINRALKSDPYAYLVKPVEKPSLQAAIELALYKFSQRREGSGSVTEKYTGWSEDLVLPDSFFIKAGNKLHKVTHGEILWIEVGADRYCDIVTAKRKYPIRTTMAYLEEKLDQRFFARVHRSYIVKLDAIEAIDDLELTITISGEDIPLGSTFKQALMRKLKTL